MVSFIYFSSKQLICSMYDWEAIIHYWWLKNCIGIPKSIMLGHFIKPQTLISEEWLILFNLRKSFANVLDSNLS